MGTIGDAIAPDVKAFIVCGRAKARLWSVGTLKRQKTYNPSTF